MNSGKFGDSLRKVKKNTRPVRNSTIGYCQDIFVLQTLHLPLRKRKLNIGTRSIGFKVLPQDIQKDLPETPLPVCKRKITTLRKLPIIAPKMKEASEAIANISLNSRSIH